MIRFKPKLVCLLAVPFFCTSVHAAAVLFRDDFDASTLQAG